MSGIQKRKKTEIQMLPANRSKTKSGKSDVEHIFPVTIPSEDLTP